MKILKRITDIVSSLLLAVFIIFVVLLVGVRLVGVEPHIVLSGSMEPDIKTGSLAYITRLSPEEIGKLKAGDIVTYLADERGTKVTHKIYEVVGPLYVKDQYGKHVPDENGAPTVAKDDLGNPIIMFTTYGINNKNTSDPSGYTLDGQPGVGNLASPNVFGKPVIVVPFLGYVAHFVQNPPGQYLVIALCALLLINTFFSGTPKKKKEPLANVKTAAKDAPVPMDKESDSPDGHSGEKNQNHQE